MDDQNGASKKRGPYRKRAWTLGQVVKIRRNSRVHEVTVRPRNFKEDGGFPMPKLRESIEFKLIADKFIMPVLNLEAFADTSRKDRVDIFFGTKYRDIVPCVAKVEFLMTGPVVNGAFCREATGHEKSIAVGVPLMVRIDSRTPNMIDVERCDTGVMFRLNSAQYRTIWDKLEELESCNERLEPPET